MTAEPGADLTSARADRDRRLSSAARSGLLLQLVATVAGLATIPVASHALGPRGYGAFATLLTASALTGFADFGVGGAVVTRLARCEPAERGPLVSAALSALVRAAALMLVGGLALTLLLPWRRMLGTPPQSTSELRVAVAVFVVAAAVSIPAGLGQRILLGLQRGTEANIWALLIRAVSLVAIVVCAVTNAPMWAFITATAGATAVVGGAQTLLLFARMPQVRPGRGTNHRDSRRALLRTGGLFLVLNLAVAFAYEADSFIVAGVRGASAAATFAVALRLFAPVTNVLTTAGQQMWPAMTEALHRDDPQWVAERIRTAVGWTVALSVAASVFIVALGPEVCRHLVDPPLVPSRTLLVAFGAWTTYSLVASQLSYLLTAAGTIGLQAVMAAAMTVSNVALSIVLTRHIGLSGPLIGSLIAHAVCSGIPGILLARHLLRRRHDVAAAT